MVNLNDLVVVTDKNNTTNGELIGIKGIISRIDVNELRYPITVQLDNGEIEVFNKEELETTDW